MKAKHSRLGIGIILLAVLTLIFRTLDRSPETPRRSPEGAHAIDPPSGVEPTPQAIDPKPIVEVAQSSVPSGRFGELLASAEKTLPLREEIKGATEEETHHPRESLLESGSALGELEAYLENHPEEYRAATRFYANCAGNEKVMSSARALCLHELRKKPAEWLPGIAEQVKNLPTSVTEVEAQL